MNIERNGGRRHRPTNLPRSSLFALPVPSITGLGNRALAVLTVRASTGVVSGLRSCR